MSAYARDNVWPQRIPQLRERGRAPIITPDPLQTFSPSILSKACSSNVPQPATTVLSTVTQTIYSTEPYATVYSTIVVPQNTTYSYGTGTITSTQSSPTVYNATRSQIEGVTDTETATSTCTETVPTRVLSGPNVTPIVTSNCNWDDWYFGRQFQFNFRMFGHTSSLLWISTNGVRA